MGMAVIRRMLQYEPTHFDKRQTNPTSDIVLWGGIVFDNRMSLIHTDDHLTADGYFTQVFMPVVLFLLQGAHNTVFQQDNTLLQVTQWTFISLTGFNILPWMIHYPYLNPIEHMWNIIRRDMNLEPLAQTDTDLSTSVNLDLQWYSSATIN
ncbi:transposable element Tcb1 transposase [Trichonephila clavipes]|nr:transposable element Tcb1 transposase [Trichonephila clavipes]